MIIVKKSKSGNGIVFTKKSINSMGLIDRVVVWKELAEGHDLDTVYSNIIKLKDKFDIKDGELVKGEYALKGE